MSSRLFLVRSELTVDVWNRIDRSGSAIGCTSRSLGEASHRLFDLMLDRRAMLIVVLESGATLRQISAALISDVFAIRDAVRPSLDHLDPVGMAGLVWRIGRGAIPLLASDEGPIESVDLVREGVADVLVPEGTDPLEWIRSWIGNRSLEALSTAARLIRSRGGESGERAEFARLFSAGVPREGLTAFLERRPPGFEDELIVETI